ncbi:hypothetical protein BKA59DRAFT_488520 [Fusarium tricinctum]|uniref:Uncharacterized protein n=1 Tax=Fusarium tricinctum TaxID=61284 RepID=A0A8K0W573_9HYPO|nr:hypothetical protein BKA59DRAFT_488520 [Fusarium tricinctum]
MYNDSALEEASSQCTAVSSYYGPGSLCGWYFIILSVIVTWRFSSKTGFRARSIAITNDFIAAILYPLLSTCHLIYLLLRCSLTRDVVGSIWFSSISQDTDLTITEDDQSSIHKGAAPIASALRVFELFTVLVICGLISTLHHELDTGRISPTTLTLLVAFLWSICVWGILFYKSWQHDALLFVLLRLFLLGVQFMVLYLLPSTLLSMISPLTWLFHQAIHVYMHLHGWLIKAYRNPSVLVRQYFRGIIQFLYNDGPMSLIMLPITWIGMTTYFLPFGLIFGMPIWDSYEDSFIMSQFGFFFPRTEIDVSELDQIAGIIGGILTLFFSIYDVTKGMNIIRNTFERCLLGLKLRLVAWV